MLFRDMRRCSLPDCLQSLPALGRDVCNSSVIAGEPPITGVIKKVLVWLAGLHSGLGNPELGVDVRGHGCQAGIRLFSLR